MTKKILSLALAVLMLAAVIPIGVTPALAAQAPVFSGGTGTEADPFIITTGAQLGELSKAMWSGNYNSYAYKLGNDIDISGFDSSNYLGHDGWLQMINFRGIFDGDGHEITGLYIESLADEMGLFGSIAGNGVVKNLGIVNANITGPNSVGGLVGVISDSGSVINCYSKGGTIDGDRYVGGLAGRISDSGSVTNSYSTGTVNGNCNVGGLSGGIRNTKGGEITVDECYSECSVSANGVVSAPYTWAVAGGIVGELEASGVVTITNCYATGNVSSPGQDNGGLGGLMNGASGNIKVSNSYATGAISGTGYIGGLFGRIENAELTNCVALNPSAKGVGFVGRAAGYNSGVLSNIRANSSMSPNGGAAFVGGNTHDGQGGADVTMQNALTSAFWTTNTATWTGWDTNVWKITEGKLPILAFGLSAPVTIDATAKAKGATGTSPTTTIYYSLEEALGSAADAISKGGIYQGTAIEVPDGETIYIYILQMDDGIGGSGKSFGANTSHTVDYDTDSGGVAVTIETNDYSELSLADLLEALIAEAEIVVSGVSVSEDGRDIAIDKYWVTGSVKAALEEVIEVVQGILDSNNPSDPELSTALNNLQDAINTFENAIKLGTKPTIEVTPTSLESSGGKVTVTITGRELGEIEVSASSGAGSEITAKTMGTDTEQKAVLNIPANAATSEKIYTITAAIDGEIYTSSDKITVKKSTGGGSGGGGGGGTAPSPEDEVTVEIPVKTETDKEGNISASVDKDAISKAIKDATKNSADDAEIIVVIEIEGGINAPGMTLDLPADAFTALSDNNVDALVVETPIGSFEFDAKSIDAIAGQSKGEALCLVLKKADLEDEALSERVGDGLLLDLHLETEGGKQISDFKGGKVAVTVPFELPKGTDPEQIVVWYVEGTDKLTEVSKGGYDSKTKTVTFKTNHFSYYLIEIRENEPEVRLPFTDVSEADWFYDDVKYVWENKIMKGIGGTLFGPNDTTTRAMIVTMLYRLENEPDVTGNSFSDVPANEWYTDAVSWGESSGVVMGVGGDRFEPERTISRQEMVTMMYRYAQYKNYDVSSSDNLDKFTDAESIADYALPAMKWAVSAGIVKGVSDTNVSPNGSSERCQVAAVFHRFMEL